MMKENVIICLGNSSDMLLAQQLASSLKKTQQEYSLITWSENNKNAGLCFHFNKIYYIDREKVQKSYQSPIFNAAHSVNMAWESLEEAIGAQWGKVYITTNNDQSYNLVDLLSAEEVIGMKRDTDGFLTSDSYWDIFLNSVYPLYPNMINFHEILHNRSQAALDTTYNFKLAADAEEVTQKNFQIIREKTAANRNIVGIDLNNIPTNLQSLPEIIFSLFHDAHFYPIIIANKHNPKHVEIINESNKMTENKLIAIFTEGQPLVSVIKRLDALITFSSPSRHIAYSLQTPVITIYSPGIDEVQTGYSFMPGNITLKMETNYIHYDDLKGCLQHLMGETFLNSFKNAEIYQTAKDKWGTVKIKLNPSSENENLANILGRYYFLNSLQKTKSMMDPNILNIFEKDDIANFTKKERMLAEQFNRYLLASFRAIGEIKGGSKTHQAILLSTIDRMLEINPGPSVLNPLKEFTKGLLDQAHLESSQGIIELEKVLFQVKNLLQNFAHFLNFDQETNKRKEIDL